jgi:protein-S-isoprenylcysteine O-methyltransferase Ste14
MKTLQSRLPLLLSVTSLVLVVGFGIRQLSGWHGATLVTGAVTVLAYIAWLLVESRVARGELSKGDTRLDGGTLELYAFARAATVILALALAREPSPGHALIGLGVFASAVLFRLHAIRVLGQFYSHRVRVLSEHRVVDYGPYRFIRHPAYTGMLLAHAGFSLVFFHVLSLSVFLFLFVPAVVLRILVEEKALYELPGYREYSASKKRLLPAVW